MTFGSWRWWGCQPHTPASFSLGVESTPGPWYGQKEICHWKFQWQHRESTPGPSDSWRSALTTTPLQAPYIHLYIHKNYKRWASSSINCKDKSTVLLFAEAVWKPAAGISMVHSYCECRDSRFYRHSASVYQTVVSHIRTFILQRKRWVILRRRNNPAYIRQIHHFCDVTFIYCQ